MDLLYAQRDGSGGPEGTAGTSPYVGTRARVAVYDTPSSAPYIEDVSPGPALDYIHSLAVRVYELARERGGPIPYTVVREVAENLIHAGFAEPVISVLDEGHTIRFSDQGPGISDKERALEPGFTTACGDMKTVIRGVGSGLPIVQEFLSLTGGSMSIEDNLSRGAVVTLRATSGHVPVSPPALVHEDPRPSTREMRYSDESLLEQGASPQAPVRLSTRQKQVLALVLEAGSAGPSIVSKELGVGLSTAYRDLASLEEVGLIQADGGKRTLTTQGLQFLGGFASPDQTLPEG